MKQKFTASVWLEGGWFVVTQVVLRGYIGALDNVQIDKTSPWALQGTLVSNSRSAL